MAIADANIAETTPPGMQMQSGDRVYLTNPEGRRVGFTYTPTYQGSWFGTMAHPAFKPDPGVTDTLTVKEGPYGLTGVVGAFSQGWNPSQYVLTTRDGTVYEYIQERGLQKITDRNNNVITFTPTAISHSSGDRIDLIRDARGRINQIVDTAGNSIYYQYDAARNLVGFTDQIGETTRYVYRDHPAHFLEEIYDAAGVRIFRADFDDDGRLTGATDALGNVVQQQFDPGAFTGTLTDARGNVTTLWYDERGNVTQEMDPKGKVTYYEYGDARHPDLETKITDRNGVVEERVYDAMANLTQVTRAAGTDQAVTTNYAYHSRGNLTTIRQANQSPTIFQYSGAGNLTTIVNATGVVASATYDTQGRQTSFTDFNGNTTVYDYTSGCPCGSPGAIIYADGTYERMQYNRYGQVTRRDVFEADGTLVETTTTDYDAQGRPIREVFGTGANRMEKRYAYSGNLLDWEIVVHPESANETPATPIIQRKSSITDYEYDAAGQITRQTDAEGGVVEFRYDVNGNRILLQDPVGNITTWVYDSLDRMVEERDPFYWETFVQSHAGLSNSELLVQVVQANQEPSGASGQALVGAQHVTRYWYDGEGNQTDIIDRNGRRREFEYDALGRQTFEHWYNPGDAAEPWDLVRTITSTYDAVGNLQSISDPDSSYTYTHDTLNRVKTVDNAGSPDMPHVILSYDYDAMGNVTRTRDNFGVSVDSTYDARSRLATRTWFDADVPDGEEPDVDPARVDFLYTATGREKRIDRYSDLDGTGRVAYTDYDYDRAGRTKQISHERAVDDVIARYDYHYDFRGLLDQEDRSGESHPNNDWHVDYRYDRTGQLLEADYSGLDVIPEQVDEYYRYDANGNRTDSYLHGTGYRTGPANQLLSDGTNDYEYDDAGNMVKKTNTQTGEVTTYEYDHRNRMGRAVIWSSDPGQGGVILHEEQYRHDALARRIQILTDTDGAGPDEPDVTTIIYNGDNAWADFSAANEDIAQYLFGNRIDQNIAMYRPGQGISWYLASKLGTVSDMINAAGHQVDHTAYSTFGYVLHQRNANSANRFLFTAREYAPQLAMYYYRARFYDAAPGRFLSADPLGFNAEVNLFRYSANTPLNAVDPLGAITMLQTGIILGTVLGTFIAIRQKLDGTGFCSNDDPSLDAAIAGAVGAGVGSLVSIVVEKKVIAPAARVLYPGVVLSVTVVGAAFAATIASLVITTTLLFAGCTAWEWANKRA